MTMNLKIAAGIVAIENQYLEKNFKLRLVKYFMFSSLSLLMIEGIGIKWIVLLKFRAPSIVHVLSSNLSALLCLLVI